jgi:hypothetical protein
VRFLPFLCNSVPLSGPATGRILETPSYCPTVVQLTGMLLQPNVRETCRFAVAPLCTVTLLLLPRMLPTEAITLQGCETVCGWRG